MIKSITEQDVEELHEHLIQLGDKYGHDFFFIGAFGIIADEEEGENPVSNGVDVYGEMQYLHNAVHRLLDTEVGAEIITDAFICHCKNLLHSNSAFSELRDKILKATKSEIIKRAQRQQAESDVSDYLDSLGLN